MTYGDSSRKMRESLVWLLGRHRILQQLGGTGSQRYRLATLTWCLQAVTAATPKTDLTQTQAPSRTPVEDLRYRLSEAVSAVGHGEPLSNLLASPHNNQLIATWQRVARAAAVGERDFSAGVNLGKLTPEQSRTVLKDAADLTRALVILDPRYVDLPGWQYLKGPTRLGGQPRGPPSWSVTRDATSRSTTAAGDPQPGSSRDQRCLV